MDEGADGLMADTLIAGTTLVEKESRSIGDVPLGGIVAWAKSLSGVPNLSEGWVECDGSVLVDALSPLNGQTLPDLNGDNRFMRGASTSGGTGGSETHIHTGSTGSQSSTRSDIATTGGATLSNAHVHNSLTINATSTLPTYYEIVWIMRVR